MEVLKPRKEKDAFRVWHRYGLGRIYFADDSWLSYSPSRACIYGPDKEGIAYSARVELGLKVVARRGGCTLCRREKRPPPPLRFFMVS
jgi:hypothetical protein